MCDCKKESNVSLMEETVEEIKDLLDEIVEEARERIKEKKEQEKNVWDQVETKMHFELNLTKLPDDKFDKEKIGKILDKALPEVVKQTVTKVIEDCRK